MTLSIGLIGATGKMGCKIAACIEKDPQMTLKWGLGSQSNRKELAPVDVIIDFSSSLALEENLILAQKHKTPLVIGTTGLQTYQQQSLELASKQIPVFWAPNFSMGMTVLIYAIEMLSPLLQKKFNASIVETHHIHKKDAPSGSALAFAQAALSGYPTPPPIESIRLQEVIGEHMITFLGPEEKITLSHEALSRDVFAHGALQAAQFILHKSPKLYGMKDLLH